MTGEPRIPIRWTEEEDSTLRHEGKPIHNILGR